METSEVGIIRLQAKEAFTYLPAEKKSMVMELVLPKENHSLVTVAYGYKRELWDKNKTSDTVVLLDSWDLNTLYIPKTKTTLKTLQKTDVHTWFLYFGMNSFFNTDMINLYCSSRLDFFLLKNRWDLALSYSAGISGTNLNADASVFTVNSDLGLMSKVYFPIKKYNISSYAGLGIFYIWNQSDDGISDEIPAYKSWHVPVYLGISWHVGSGSLDFGLQTGKNTNFTIGYTFSPAQLFGSK